MVGCGLDRGRSSKGIWLGGIWIDPEEGGELFECFGWAGGETEKVEALVGSLMTPRGTRESGGGGIQRMGQDRLGFD